jgi:hypothetical protein
MCEQIHSLLLVVLLQINADVMHILVKHPCVNVSYSMATGSKVAVV